MLNIEEAVWFLSLSSQPSESKHIMRDNCELQVQPLTPKDLYEAQRGDNAINTVMQFKTSGKPLTLKDKQRANLLEKTGSSERVLHVAREQFFWQHMKRDIEHYVTHDCSCLKQRRPNIVPRAPMENIHTTAPFELVSLVFVHLEKSKGGY